MVFLVSTSPEQGHHSSPVLDQPEHPLLVSSYFMANTAVFVQRDMLCDRINSTPSRVVSICYYWVLIVLCILGDFFQVSAQHFYGTAREEEEKKKKG